MAGAKFLDYNAVKPQMALKFSTLVWIDEELEASYDDICYKTGEPRELTKTITKFW